jgi:MFS family permease
LAGAVGDKYGYKKTLLFAYFLLAAGYLLTSQATQYELIFISLASIGVGAGIFKPIISGTIAKETTETTSSLAFGIYYWSINLSAFIIPLLLVPYVKNNFGWNYVMVSSAVITLVMLLLTSLFYKEPPKAEIKKQKTSVLKEIILVLSDFKFIILILIYSGFGILYYLMADSILWYVDKYVDASQLNEFINRSFSLLGIKMNWKFDVEHVTVFNAGFIIILQLFVSNFVKKFKPLPTIVVGLFIASTGTALFSLSTNIWIFILAVFVFALGEMTAQPKFLSYVGMIAPEENKALYLSYSFLYIVIGSAIGGILGAKLYIYFVDKLNNPSLLWITFSLVGYGSALGLLLYDRLIQKKSISKK